MTLRDKLSLPSPKWILFGLFLLAIVGIGKLLAWLVPVAVVAITKLTLWLAPIIWSLASWLASSAWQAVILVLASICAIIAYWWRTRQQTKLYEDVLSGTSIIINPEYKVQ